MSTNPNGKKTVIIIGAGIAGLSAGIYAQLNGYQSRIYEMHNQPGGLMTAWKRKGYTIDGCIHWLTGSGPNSSYYQFWQEIGLIQGREIFNPEVFMRFEAKDGRQVNVYANIDRFEQHLIEIAPEDTKIIKQMCAAAHAFRVMSAAPGQTTGWAGKAAQTVKSYARFIRIMPRMFLWGRMTLTDLSRKFSNPLLRDMFTNLWMPDMSAVALLFIMAFLHENNAGYPIGGSMPMAHAVEKRYCDLGGEMHYNSRVEKILVEPVPGSKTSRAVGIRLSDGREERADYVISAADGHTTLWNMLDGQFLTDKIRKIYADFKLFPPILLVGLGANRTFPELPAAIGGIEMQLDQPIDVGGKPASHLSLMVYNFDPTLAPQGKTALTAMIETDYEYWKELSGEPERYETEKQRIGLEVIRRLDQRFPGLEGQVEMADVATPMTFERYTGNWRASFEGFLPMPSNITTAIPKVLPSLENFAMCGQWVQVGGGLPSGVSTGREVIGKICKQDGRKFLS
jgi:phytoene dehydrogenase-like protein